MKKIYLIIAFLFCCTFLYAQTFTLRSNELGGQATNTHVLNGFGCNGENRSPQLYWENAPQDTKSFAVTVHDEDAPTGSGWWHWMIFDIPKNITELETDSGNTALNIAPPGSVQSITDFQVTGYGGPCPPDGDDVHKYTVTVYALKCDKLQLDESANPALVGFMLQQNLIEKASLVFYYKR